jgi:hypothetical protein
MRTLTLAFVLVTIGVATVAAEDHRHAETSTDYIGTARMLDDGTLELFLVAHGSDGIIGHSFLIYRRGDAQYEAILAHVSPMRPGQSRPVRPWPSGK